MPMLRLRVALGVAVLAAIAAPAAHADIVHLRNGSTLEGNAIETNEGWEVRLKLGVITLKRDEVRYVTRRKTTDELYQERLAQVDLADPDAVQRFARWCAESGLDAQADELRRVARGALLEKRVSAVTPGDARGFYETAMWASAEGYSRDVYRYLLEKAVEADPDHAGARRALGQSLHEGVWRSDEEIARLREEEYEQRMRERGLVKYDGRWMTPDAAAFEAERAELERRKAALAADSAALAGEREELDRVRRELEELRAGLEKLKDELAAERARLEEFARELDRRGQAQGYRYRRTEVYTIPYPVPVIPDRRCDPRPYPYTPYPAVPPVTCPPKPLVPRAPVTNPPPRSPKLPR